MPKIGFNRRFAIFVRDDFVCCFCGHFSMPTRALPKIAQKEKRLPYKAILTLDHLYPKNLGGDDHHLNLATCCKSCNKFKTDKTVDDLKSPFWKKGFERANTFTARSYEPCHDFIRGLIDIHKSDKPATAKHLNKLIRDWKKLPEETSFIDYTKSLKNDS